MKLKYFELAKKLSEKSDYRHRLGAVIVKKNRILGFGWNKPSKTSPHSNNPFKTTHAELSAILNTDRQDLIGSTIYVYRQHADGSPALSRPCQFCQQLIKEAKIKKVCYTDYNNFVEYEV